MSDKPVGYGNPPVHSRFKKGKTGNPGGRKKGSHNIKTILAELMKTEVGGRENGRKSRMSVLEGLLKKFAECGLQGDWRAIDSLLDRYERHCPDRSEPKGELPEQDSDMLDRFLKRRSDRRAPPEGPKDPDVPDGG